MENQAEKKKNKTPIILIIIALAIVVIGVICVIIFSNGNGNENESDTRSSRDERDKEDDEDEDDEDKDREDKNSDEPEYITFGTYEQDGDLDNGPEPIEWEVVASDENGTLLVSRYILDYQRYNKFTEEVTWETCSLRTWLNDDFYNTAFTPEEQAMINTTTVVNADNSYYGTSGGNDTEDKIFCLSIDEILKYYSFNTYDEEEGYGHSQQLITPVTQYAKDQGAGTHVISETEDWVLDKGYSEDCIGAEGGMWWLRSPSCDNTGASEVNAYGATGPAEARDAVGYNAGVRPAMYIAQ
jgi:hypothetical protein